MPWPKTLWLHVCLVWSIGMFVARLGTAELVQHKLALVSTIAVSLLVAIAFLQVTKAVEMTLAPPVPLELAISTAPESATYRLSQTELEEQLTYFLAVLKQQPTHLGLLLNVGMLYETLGNTREAHYYFELAAKNNRPTPRLVWGLEK
ncbi:MAG: hypothetical protein A3A82_00235 [Candidatus Pacebacteria bacterium RIFCSPLOWO2_01_FULL_47_12]|nr:MAG: hypothetical protein A3A82_00235 [Candidatus Pacebacteria bacterium RIFCSPLOWO2_01_FULL_47_12]